MDWPARSNSIANLGGPVLHQFGGSNIYLFLNIKINNMNKESQNKM